MSNLSYAPHDRLVEMEDFVRDRTHGDLACESAVKSLMGAAYSEAVRRGDGQLAFSLLIEAVDVVWDIRHSLAPMVLAPDPYHGRLWAHADNFSDLAKGGAWSIDQWVPAQEDVEGAAADYLKHPWMSDGHIDWCLVDALTRREIVGYGAAVAAVFPKAWTSAWAFQKLFGGWIPLMFEVAIANAAAVWLRSEFLSPEASSYRWTWTVSIAVYYVWVVARLPGWVRSLKLRRRLMSETVWRLQAMHECYTELKGPVLDPTRVRDALLSAEKLGVRWSRATWPLFGGAIGRHPRRWMTTLR